MSRLVRQPAPAHRRLLLLVAALACAPAPANARDGEWVLTAWRPHEHLPHDRGTGVVFSEATGATPRVDTLPFRVEAREDAPLVAMLLTEYDTSGGWRYALLTRDAVSPNLLEYGYEEAGVPTDTVKGGWARGLLAQLPDGTLLSGWAAIRAGASGHLDWATHVPQQLVYLPEGWAGTLHDSPAGPPVDPPATGSEASLHVLDVRPPWMQIRLVSPPDSCVTDDGLPRMEAVRWLRYLDTRGRPLVWYYTRGC